MSTHDQDQMSPEASPGKVTKGAGVRRVNNMPLYIIGSVMVIFLLVMVMVASERSKKQNRPADAKEVKVGNTYMFAKEIAGDKKDGIIQGKSAPQLAVPDLSVPPLPDRMNSVAIARPDNLDAPNSNRSSSPNLQPPFEAQSGQRNEEAERIRLTKMQQLEEAVKAKTGINATAPRSASSSSADNGGRPTTREEQVARLAAVRQQIEASTRDDPTAAYKARLQMIQASGMGTGGGNLAPPKLMSVAAGNNDVAQFDGAGQGDRWKLNSQPEAPRSPYELRAGFVVPATLISGINSEMPGQIIGQVAQNVYDTPTGKYLLIPQGSRLVGAYSSNVVFGQARVLVAWQRIVFPDGKAMDIGSMPGSDSAGYAGLTDQVNNHYVRLFSSAILMSAVTAGVSLSQPTQNGTTAPTASSAMSEALGQQLGQVTAQLIAKNMSIAPTLEIRPGYRFNVMVTKDITFSKPYQSFDY